MTDRTLENVCDRKKLVSGTEALVNISHATVGRGEMVQVRIALLALEQPELELATELAGQVVIRSCLSQS